MASASPRRAEFLRQLGVNFVVMPADIDEKAYFRADPAETVKNIALEKAKRVFAVTHGAVLAADSAVVYGGEIFGKPKDVDDAVRMLHILSGSVHEVMTGVAYVAEGKTVLRCIVTTMRLSAGMRKGDRRSTRRGRTEFRTEIWLKKSKAVSPTWWDCRWNL